jgi:glycine oxidase
MKVAIAGGGIAGLAIGWRLAEAGADVTVFERDVAGRSATWAAAGMLSAGAEASSMGGARSFAREARLMWPAFARALEEASGIDCRFRESGALVVAHDGEGARALRAEAEQLRASGAEAVSLEAREAREHEPSLAPHIAGALLVPGDGDVDNRRLGEALIRAFERAGGTLRERCQVQSILSEGEKAVGLLTADGAVRADAVVVAMGAWSSALPGAAALPAVKPVKGQLVSFAPPKGVPVPRRVVGDHHVYLVPRGDRVLVGATVEDAGFDTSVRAASRDELVSSAAHIIPAAAEWRVVETWSGLRPRCAGDAPALGEAAPGLFVATGQFRNGILFAPAVAEAMAACVLGRECALAVDAFHPGRFART